MSMLRPLARSSAFAAKGSFTSSTRRAMAASVRAMGTHSTNDAQRPTALAKLHLEDGSTITAKSFGSHEAVEGEVSRSDAFSSPTNTTAVICLVQLQQNLMICLVCSF